MMTSNINIVLLASSAIIAASFARADAPSVIAPCPDEAVACVDPAPDGSAEAADGGALDKAIRGLVQIGGGAAAVGRAVRDAAEERAPDAIEAGRDFAGRAAGFLLSTRDRFLDVLAEEEAR